jgi:hypothetical protein
MFVDSVAGLLCYDETITGLNRAPHFGARKASRAFHYRDISEVPTYVCRFIILRADLYGMQIAANYKNINLNLKNMYVCLTFLYIE